MVLFRPSYRQIGSSPKSSGAIVRFVDSHFDEQSTSNEIRRLFGKVNDIQYRALTLRAIFLAMARKSDEA